ncbi:ribbon-helix-helix protein, CopG family [Baileyella intestinalis]|uniref:ribbon-helix-helix protein, CopG family n=1 Tax=Baileyella intestinalis TaxID=2606709 RepID=UPI0022E6AFE8|nr:ribbon-helix-helix protein, CopG family [Baileyella intestinalis]
MLADTIRGEINMARPKKNGTYLNVCIETPIYERLEKLCKDAGQTKTVAVERALNAYLDDYDRKKEKLRELEI